MSRPGLAAERTALAWRRTAVAAMAVGALFLNHAAAGRWRPTLILPMVAALTMAVLAAACYLRNRALRRGRFEHGGPLVAATAVVVVVIAVVAIAIACTDPLL